MIGELSLYGVLFPPLLLSAGAALLGMAVLRRLLARVGFYRLVWQPALVDLSLFILLVGAIDTVAFRWLA